ncbi:MAG: hypothetical protein PUA63_02835, partial [Oscillospiraceae bacterium]|nr:hypothetical protein [Oscillospiraceae bacterium]
CQRERESTVTMKIQSWVWSCGPTVFRERSWGIVLRMKHLRQKWTGYLLFDAAIRPSLGESRRRATKLDRIFFKSRPLTNWMLNLLLQFAIDKEFRKTTSAWKYLVVIIAYLCCCIPMITRMQTQHFVPICFLMLFAGTLELAETTSWITGRILEIRQVKKGTQTVCVLCCVVLSLLFLNDRFMILNEIEVTGGNGFYTSQINKLADDALENFEKGEKEIYLFPEWGFMSGFNYITNNHVAFSTNSSSENMKKLMNEGYDVLVVYWNDSDTKTYSDLLNDAGAETIIKYAYVGNEGRADFYKLEGSMQE